MRSALSLTPLLLLLSLRHQGGCCGAAAEEHGTSSSSSSLSSSWYRELGTNVNYRITAVLDVNGGAGAGPSFESFTDDDNHRKDVVVVGLLQEDDVADEKSASTTTTTTSAGYSVPIDVITLMEDDGTYRQRVSYYNGMQVDYNENGRSYKVVPTPYEKDGGDDDAAEAETTCFFMGGSSEGGDAKNHDNDDDDDDDDPVGYLNFFPTSEQMEHYTLGKLVTNEPGVPYRIATLQAHHGSSDASSESSEPDSSYGSRPGMPSDDWFQFHFEDSPSSSSSSGKGNAAAVPLKWTMLARNQIINAHTENWVVRYLSHESIDGEDERKMWGEWFDSKLRRSCGDGDGQGRRDDAKFDLVDDRGLLRSSRLGMFFSTSSSSSSSSSSPSSSRGDEARADDNALPLAGSAPLLDEFDLFVARHNKHYPRNSPDYSKRRAIHDANVESIQQWNEEHAGRTAFAANEFLDLETKEVMQFRGGHVPRGKKKAGGERAGRRAEVGRTDGNNKRNLRFAFFDKEPGPQLLFGEEEGDAADDEDEDEFTTHEVPADFDPSTLPTEFDWREHLPGSVNPVKDQGFCGSCWAFSFVSALESHWFIARGQSVNLPEQFVNDCAWSDGAHACDGGQSSLAAADILDKFGGRVPTRDAYGGYLSVDGGCYLDVLRDAGVMTDGDEEEEEEERAENKPKPVELSAEGPTSAIRLTDWVVLPERDDVATKHALYTRGPLAVGVNVVDEALYYSSGVLDVASCTKNGPYDLDHAINLVGWGVDELPGGGTAEHWILRNSWSDLWGDAGYFRVRMGERDCGITTSAGYPVVPKAEVSEHGLAELAGEVAAS